MVVVCIDFRFAFGGLPRPLFDGVSMTSLRFGGGGVRRTDLNAPSFGTFFSAYGKPIVNVIALDTFSLITIELDFRRGDCGTDKD